MVRGGGGRGGRPRPGTLPWRRLRPMPLPPPSAGASRAAIAAVVGGVAGTVEVAAALTRCPGLHPRGRTACAHTPSTRCQSHAQLCYLPNASGTEVERGHAIGGGPTHSPW
eukprot:COSAG01_NODE_182_length_22838_cov_34.788733_22_plen_111_part_00